MSKDDKSKKSESVMYIILAICLVLIVMMFIVNNVVFTRVEVIGDSMNTTLVDGDVLVVSKFAKATRDDIVVIDKVKAVDTGYELLIKRVIALGGDKIKFSEGFIWRKTSNDNDFVKLSEADNTIYGEAKYLIDVEYTIDDGKVFFLGDNRGVSLDSRYYGSCDYSDIIGVVPNWSVTIKKVTTFTNKILGPIRKFISKGSCN